MISLKINDLFVVLKSGTKIRMDIISPVLSDDEISGTYSFPISCEFCDINHRIFKHVNIVSQTEGFLDKYPCGIFLDNIPWKSGFFILDNTNNSYDGNLQVDAGGFYQKIKDVKIKDLTYDVITIPPVGDNPIGEYAAPNFNKFYPDVNVNFPLLLNDGLYTNFVNGLDARGLVNWFMNHDGSGSGTNHQLQSGYCMAFPFLFYVLDVIFESLNYKKSGSFFLDDELKKLIISNIFPDNRSENDLLWENLTISIKDHLPDIYISTFLARIKQTFCLIPIFDDVKKEAEFIFFNDILNDEEYVDLTHLLSGPIRIQKTNYSGYNLSNVLDNDDDLSSGASNLLDGTIVLPSVTFQPSLPIPANIGDIRLVTSYKQYWIYNSGWNYNAGDAKWNFLCHAGYQSKTITKLDGYTVLDPVSTYGLLPIVGNATDDVRFVIKLNQYWVFKTNTWLFLTDPSNEINIDGGGKKVEAAGTLSMIKLLDSFSFNHGDGGYTVEYLVPIARQLASSYSFADELRECAFRLLFYRGMQKDSTNNDYPFATRDTYNYAGTKIGNYSLGVNGEDGLYEKFHKKKVDFWKNTKPCIADLNLNNEDLRNLNLKKKIMLNGTKFLIGKISPTFPLNQPTTVEIYTV